MSTHTLSPRGPIDPSRATTGQLLYAAAMDTDAVSVFIDGFRMDEDTEAAVLVVKGREHIDYILDLCRRQGLLTPGKPVEAS